MLYILSPCPPLFIVPILIGSFDFVSISLFFHTILITHLTRRDDVPQKPAKCRAKAPEGTFFCHCFSGYTPDDEHIKTAQYDGTLHQTVQQMTVHDTGAGYYTAWHIPWDYAALFAVHSYRSDFRWR